MYTAQQILSLSTSISKIEQPHNDLINFSNSSVLKEFELWSDRLLNSCSKENLLKSVNEIVFILNRLPNFEYTMLSKQIDESHPGVSFCFIVEGIQHYESDSYKFFIDRLCKFRDNSLLLNIFSPTRTSLISELLKNIKPFTPAEIFKVNDDEIIFVLKEMVEDWEDDEPDVFIVEDKNPLVPNFNGKKIYLRRALK